MIYNVLFSVHEKYYMQKKPFFILKLLRVTKNIVLIIECKHTTSIKFKFFILLLIIYTIGFVAYNYY